MEAALIDGRVVWLAGCAIAIGVVASLVAEALIRLIALITNLSFYGRISWESVGPVGNQLGWFVVAVPVVGAMIVGFTARYGSKTIRGRGIPEAMEQVLTNRSRIPARVTFLKPLSSAIAIGTGGPFGAEGPIIATGGALGSLVGQFLPTTAAERKTLLAVGAAAGMAATFGSPVSAVLMAIELLLFEFRPRSIIPVALGATTAAGVVGYFAPRTLGVGYDNISAMLSDRWTTQAIFLLCVMKFLSWSIALGSGTSGGTLAPMFTIGGGVGHLLGAGVVMILPWAGIDMRVAALVGMAAIFAGAWSLRRFTVLGVALSHRHAKQPYFSRLFSFLVSIGIQ